MNSTLKKVFAQQLREARNARGLNQTEAAARAGIATEAFGRLERGRVLPSSKTLVKLARALDVRIDVLLGLDESRHRSRREETNDASVRRTLRRLRSQLKGAAKALSELTSALR